MTTPLDIMTTIYERWWHAQDSGAHVPFWESRRSAFHLSLVLSAVRPGATICDLGGGWGAFATGCMAAGLKAILIDDFKDPVVIDPQHKMAESRGVTVITRDIVRDGIDFPPESVDVFTSFDSIEHWHHSPKKLFAQVTEAMRPGGLFLLGAPNCVNLRKRIAFPLGIGSWTRMRDWYEYPEFRGHVREPSLADLRYIARDMGLVDVKCFGRNWLGKINPRRSVRVFAAILDRPLRLCPSLCSDIYMMGRKAAKQAADQPGASGRTETVPNDPPGDDRRDGQRGRQVMP